MAQEVVPAWRWRGWEGRPRRTPHSRRQAADSPGRRVLLAELATEPRDALPDLVRDPAQGRQVGRTEMAFELREQGLDVHLVPVQEHEDVGLIERHPGQVPL